MNFIEKNELGIVRLNDEVLKFPYLEIFKKSLDKSPCSLEFDIYRNSNEDAKRIHDLFGGNSVEYFREAVISEIISKNKTEAVWRIGLNDFMVEHKKCNIQDFMINYQGLIISIRKTSMTIRVC